MQDLFLSPPIFNIKRILRNYKVYDSLRDKPDIILNNKQKKSIEDKYKKY